MYNNINDIIIFIDNTNTTLISDLYKNNSLFSLFSISFNLFDTISMLIHVITYSLIHSYVCLGRICSYLNLIHMEMDVILLLAWFIQYKIFSHRKVSR